MMPSVPLAERFWRYVERGEPAACWTWGGYRTSQGYGTIKAGGKYGTTLLAHRVSWSLENRREIPEGLFVCHSCDTPACVNPAHLWLGTHTDNIRDAKRKGRLKRAAGESNDGAKLNNQQVLEIRSAVGKQADIAKKFGISHQTVWAIKNRERWSHLP